MFGDDMKSSTRIYDCKIHKSVFKVGLQETSVFYKKGCYFSFNSCLVKQQVLLFSKTNFLLYKICV